MIVEDERLVRDQTKIIQLISSGEPLESILEFIVSSMEKHCYPTEMYGSILLFDSDRKQLSGMVSSSLPENYKKAMQPITVGPYEGPCGTAAYLRKPVIVLDIDHDPLWDKYRYIAKQFGFRSCWSTPIISSKSELLGTFALYYKVVHKPDQKTMTMFETYNRLAAIAIEISRSINKQMQNDGYLIEGKKQRKKTGTENVNLLSQLQLALQREEFEVYYQPHVGVKSKELGIEALIRWNHPKLGLLTPSSFLGIAEETGFILEMEKWVLTKSINDVKAFQQKGIIDIGLSVNVSAQQFEMKDFPDMISDLLQRFSFHPGNLTLEVTERFIVRQDNIHVLHKLKECGIRISIDDFGTSYSSLKYLKDLPVDEIKIDRSFISNMEADLNTQKIVEMIILLGHQLDLDIVAEGVETARQFQLLKDMNCDKVQGFLFSKPESLATFDQQYMDKVKETMV